MRIELIFSRMIDVPIANERAHWRNAQGVEAETRDVPDDCSNWDSLPDCQRPTAIGRHRSRRASLTLCFLAR